MHGRSSHSTRGADSPGSPPAVRSAKSSRVNTIPGLFLAFVGAASVFAQAAAGPAAYHRFPALHGETVVFTSEGDLWQVPTTGGVAQRVTTHPGMEAHAAISPDGTTLAFSAEYEGPTEVYTMPLAGGLPVRRTFDGVPSTAVGWTPEQRLVFRTRVHSDLPNDQLATLDLRTGLREVLPLAQATEAAWAPDGPTLFFTRLPHQGSSTKRYRGGTAQSLWRFSPRETEATPLTADFKGTSKNPMWWRDRVYFLSDRDGIMNVWSIRPDGADPRAHTRHRDYDVQSACLHEGRVVYQQGADLRLLDLADDSNRLIPIRLVSDFDQQRELWVRKPVEYLTSAHLAPKGDRVVLTARGQVFVAPVEPGRFVEVPRQGGVRYRQARFLPDGQSLVALSDETRELEFWRLPANGLGTPVQLTTNGSVFRFEGVPSPDGAWLAFGDKNLRLWLHHLDRRETLQVAESAVHQLTDFAWSPDSQWFAYAEPATNRYRQIKLFRPQDGTRVTATSDRVDSYSPAWSPDGKWLYFLSDREIRSLVPSPWGPFQPDPFFVETTKIYQLALAPGLRSPFVPADELSPEEPEKREKPEKPEKKETAVPPPAPTALAVPSGDAAVAPVALTASGSNAVPAGVVVAITVEGLAGRLHEVPVPAGNYDQLSVTAKHVLWIARDTGFEGKRHLRQLEITARQPKAKTLVEDLRDYEVSNDGKKLLVRKGDDFHVLAADAAAPAKLEDKVSLEGWTFPLQPREEWRQIFTEAWRMMRDYFYDRGLHQVDWPAMLRKYLPLVDRVSDRAELSDHSRCISSSGSGMSGRGRTASPPRRWGLSWSATRRAGVGGWSTSGGRIRSCRRPGPRSPGRGSTSGQGT